MMGTKAKVIELPPCPTCGKAVTALRYGDRVFQIPRVALPEAHTSIKPNEFEVDPCGHRVFGFLAAEYGVRSWIDYDGERWLFA